MVTLMKPLCGHANGAGLAPGGMAQVRQFRKADAGWDLRDAEPNEIGQKMASSPKF